jgi:hypothetical protein
MVKKSWIKVPAKPPRPKASAAFKTQVQMRADELIASVIEPHHVKPPPEDARFNYVVDVSSRWHGNSFYFVAKYRCPAPTCMTEFFEMKFARMQYAGSDRFKVSSMRHTEKWFELYQDMPFEECLQAIAEEPHFIP